MQPLVEYKIVTGDESREVIFRMIGDGRSRGEARKALDVFMRFSDRCGIDVSRQAAALVDGRLVGYCLILVNAGATASVFLPEKFPNLPAGLDERTVKIGLLKILAEQVEAWDLAMIQAIVPKEKVSLSALFESGGFCRLCDLFIMEATVNGRFVSEEPLGVEWIGYSAEKSSRFVRTILDTYEGSRDCPQLTGLRRGREILTGHLRCGLFESRGWWLLNEGGRDVGVILLNSTEEDSSRLELVYMGVAGFARRRGLGRMLLSRAFEVAGWLDKKDIRLAVDGKNIAAVRLYQQFGFHEIGHQTVLAVLNEKRRDRIKASNGLDMKEEHHGG